MARKPPFQVVSSAVSSETGPTRPLGVHGQKLWDTVMVEYDIQDGGGRELLLLACEALDRAEALREEIERDGPVIRSRGSIKDHPALKHELANRAFVVRTLHRLGLDVEPLRFVGRPTRGWEPVA